jgi:predicted transcriptional regulator
MKSVLISIKPKWCEKIASGEKTIEVRKSAPQEVPFKAYIYETQGRTETPWIDEDGHFIYKGRGQVIGEFICDKVYPIKNQGSSFVVANEEQGVTNEIAGQSCLYYDDMVSYFGDKDGYGWHISELKIYDKPRELSEFGQKCDNANEIRCRDCLLFEEWDNCCSIMCKPLTRPPQSWQYVEDLGEEK